MRQRCPRVLRQGAMLLTGAVLSSCGPDLDLDGYTLPEDCNPFNAEVHPGVTEVCDGIDNNCDGQADEGLLTRYYIDRDYDTYGDDTTYVDACAQPIGHVTRGGDCDDYNPRVNPGMEEVCNDNLDNNCNLNADQCQWRGSYLVTDVSETTIVGEAPVDQAGISIDVGNFNGDTYGDPAIGAYLNDGGAENAGAAYALNGPLIPVESLLLADARFTGTEQLEQAGFDISACNLNGDEYDDLVIGAYGALGFVGAAYVVYGPFDGTVSLADAEVKIVGSSVGDLLGWSVACDGDFDGDGLDDVVIGAPGVSSKVAGAGAAYLFYGPVLDGDYYAIDADATLWGSHQGALAGATVAYAGDMDADGKYELAIGSYLDNTAAKEAGVVYIQEGPVMGSFELSNATTILTGETDFDAIGWSIDSAGDINNDGRDDLLIGAPTEGNSLQETGSTYVIHGPLSAGTFNIRTVSHAKITGMPSGGLNGYTVAGVGDLNGDQYDDFMIGDPADSDGGVVSGSAFLYLGPIPGGTYDNYQAVARYRGTGDGELLGYAIAGGVDFNGDNRKDVILSAVADVDMGGTGTVYVVYGKGI